jgi:hypothetical protein
MSIGHFAFAIGVQGKAHFAYGQATNNQIRNLNMGKRRCVYLLLLVAVAIAGGVGLLSSAGSWNSTAVAFSFLGYTNSAVTGKRCAVFSLVSRGGGAVRRCEFATEVEYPGFDGHTIYGLIAGPRPLHIGDRATMVTFDEPSKCIRWRIRVRVFRSTVQELLYELGFNRWPPPSALSERLRRWPPPDRTTNSVWLTN